MRLSTWTFLPLFYLISNAVGKSLKTVNTDLLPKKVVASKYYNLDELERLKERIRAQVKKRTVYNSVPRLNQTVEEKRRILRQFRAKLKELNQLDSDMDYQQQTIHEKDLHSYQSTGM